MAKDNQVILITGASSGIGFDAAQALAEQGHRVYAAARRVERMEPLRAYGVQVLRMDLTDEASLVEGVEAVIQAEGRLDVLVNNAGYGYFGAIENVPLEDARRQLEVNVFGLARLTQLVLPYMRQQGSGRIVNTSSIAGKMTILMGGWYNVTKYSVEAFSDALRMEVKPYGIQVVKIQPGAIKTEWGLIAAQHLKASSAGTAYETTGTCLADNMDWYYHSNLLASPKVVTRAICRAVNRRHPRVRYRCGTFSFVGPLAHAVLPARWMDALMRLVVKFKKQR